MREGDRKVRIAQPGLVSAGLFFLYVPSFLSYLHREKKIIGNKERERKRLINQRSNEKRCSWCERKPLFSLSQAANYSVNYLNVQKEQAFQGAQPK